MRHFFTVVFALFSFACSYRPAEELVLDPTLSDKQISAVTAAADDWCEKASLCVKVSIGEDRGTGYVTHIPKCAPTVGASTDQGPDRAPTVTLCDDRDEILSIAAAHEIGHALTGKDSHLEKTGHVMSVNNKVAVDSVTDLDVEWSQN